MPSGTTDASCSPDGGNALAIRTAVRVTGHAVPVAPRDLATAFPGATAKLAGSVHGLADTETS